MAYLRENKSDIRNKIKVVTDSLKELRGQPEWIAYQKMIKLGQQELENLENKWKLYYQKLKNTRAYKRFFEQRDAFKKKDYILVKRLASEARRDRENANYELPKPSTYDPNWLAKCNCIARVLALEGYLGKLQAEQNDADFTEDLLNS